MTSYVEADAWLDRLCEVERLTAKHDSDIAHLREHQDIGREQIASLRDAHQLTVETLANNTGALNRLAAAFEKQTKTIAMRAVTLWGFGLSTGTLAVMWVVEHCGLLDRFYHSLQ
jgi:chlorite dismutase